MFSCKKKLICKNVLPAYSSAKIIVKKSNEFFQSYAHKFAATFL